jgi:uncharacterized protein YkwD
MDRLPRGKSGIMTFQRSFLGHGGRLAAVAALVLFSACTGDHDPPPGQPSFYRSLASGGAQLDAATAASMISGYRSNNGLSSVSVDSELMKLAEAQAQAMASRDKLDHNVIRGFNERLRSQGYRAKSAAENISAGYHTLAEAFSGWRDSPPHRANMLLKDATRIGIAAVYVPKSKYKVFWALILAAPDDRRVARQ